MGGGGHTEEGPLGEEDECMHVHLCTQMEEGWVEARLSGSLCVCSGGSQAGMLPLGHVSLRGSPAAGRTQAVGTLGGGVQAGASVRDDRLGRVLIPWRCRIRWGRCWGGHWEVVWLPCEEGGAVYVSTWRQAVGGCGGHPTWVC